MKRTFCDICGKEIKGQGKRAIPDKIKEIVEAEDVCAECAGSAREINWRCVVRDEIARKKEKKKD